MSELKPYTHVADEPDAETNKYALYAYDVDGKRTKIDDTELVYLKSEADKVIAELKNEIEKQKRLRDMALASVPNVLKVMKIIQHQKYKRCLAMAAWCDAERDIFNLTPKVTKVEFFARWHKRWLEIATKFKEAK